MNFSGQYFKLKKKEGIIYGLVMALLYYCGGYLGVTLMRFGDWGAPLWAPSGLGVAFVLMFGLRWSALGILLGSYLITLHFDLSFLSILGHLMTNLLEAALAGKLLMTVSKGKFRFKDYNEVIAFLCLAAVLSPMAAQTFGTFIQYLIQGTSINGARMQPIEYALRAIGNSLGILIFTPLMIHISFIKRSMGDFYMKGIEGIIFLASLSWAIYFSFSYQRLFLVYPFIIWAALRFNYMAVSVSSLLIALFGILTLEENQSRYEICWIQAYIGTCAFTGYLLSTMIYAQKKITKQEQEVSLNLKRREMAEEALGLLDQAVQKSPIGFSLISKDLRFIRVNEFMAQINGYPADFHTGRSIFEIVPSIAPYVEDAVSHVFRTGESMMDVPSKVTSRVSPFKSYSGHVAYYPVRLPGMREIFGVAIVFNDMTEQKAIEARLRKAEAELKSALVVRDEFFAIASHELKTPLTSLKLQIQLHQKSLGTNDPQALTKVKIEQLLSRNNRQTERLTRLVDDMLDISRIRTGKLTLKKELCEIGPIVGDIIYRSREQFVASGSGDPHVSISSKALGLWDPMRIEQVISNVISNAIRYGQGKPIKIEVSKLEKHVRISVTDQGKGIPPEEKERIFQRFERGNLTRDNSGLGLGLFISEQITSAHEGRIWFESVVDQGSTFHIELPVYEDSENFAIVG